MRLVISVAVDNPLGLLETKINVFALGAHQFAGHVLRRLNGEQDWVLQSVTSECTSEFRARDLARDWCRKNPHSYNGDACNAEIAP